MIFFSKQIQEEEEEPVTIETEEELEKEHERLASRYHNEKTALAEALRVSVSVNSSRSSSPDFKNFQSGSVTVPFLSSIEKLPVPKRMKNPAPLGPAPINEEIEDEKQVSVQSIIVILKSFFSSFQEIVMSCFIFVFRLKEEQRRM